jgi:hypothetical protein
VAHRRAQTADLNGGSSEATGARHRREPAATSAPHLTVKCRSADARPIDPNRVSYDRRTISELVDVSGSRGKVDSERIARCEKGTMATVAQLCHEPTVDD